MFVPPWGTPAPDIPRVFFFFFAGSSGTACGRLHTQVGSNPCAFKQAARRSQGPRVAAGGHVTATPSVRESILTLCSIRPGLEKTRG